MLIPGTRRAPAKSTLLLLTSALQPSAEVLPGLALLSHTVKIVPAQGSALLDAPDAELVLWQGDDAPRVTTANELLPGAFTGREL